MEEDLNKPKKKMPIFVYFILMIFLFVGVLLFQQVFASFALAGLSNFKYGQDALFEILWAGLVLLVVLLFKNRYIFTQKREPFFASLKYVMPELILSGFFLVFSIIVIISENKPVEFGTVANLALYCIFIGIVEEFLCRGWLLNEFLERYSANRKEIITSIICSSFIFGVIHFLNLGETQGLVETIVQVFNAAAGGVFLSLVYYKTKNIWVVVCSHAIWDFSLFLSQVNSLGDCLTGVPSKTMIIVNIVRSIVLTGSYLALCYWMYTKTDLYLGPKKGSHKALVPIGIIVYLIGLFFINATEEDYRTCPDYQKKKIEDGYSITTYKYETYKIKDYDISLEKDKKDNIILKNDSTDESIILANKDEYNNYILIDNHDSYTIMIQTLNNALLYGTFPKSDVNNNSSYLKTIKDKLIRYVVTEISSFATITVQNTDYQYPVIRNSLGEYLYFDQENKLYLNK